MIRAKHPLQPYQAVDVAVLFARQKSVYKRMAGVDVFDQLRDARTYTGSLPVVAHPPCRAWGRLKGVAKPREDERSLAFFALSMVRKNGGVLEHPADSSFWKVAGLPSPGEYAQFSGGAEMPAPGENAQVLGTAASPGEYAQFSGGFTLALNQGDYGHSAPKATWLYVVGVDPALVPVAPSVGAKTGRVALMSLAERESTPWQFAYWLVGLARLVGSCSK